MPDSSSPTATRLWIVAAALAFTLAGTWLLRSRQTSRAGQETPGSSSAAAAGRAPPRDRVESAASCVRSQSDELALELIGEGFSFPVDLQAPPKDERLFVVEQSGAIQIIAQAGRRSTPFLDLSERIEAKVRTYDERGLLGLAFHPRFRENGRFFINYTVPEGPARANSRVSEFRVSSDPNQADLHSEVRWLEVEQPFANHEGGGLVFGPDGYLYVGFGDGGGGCDPTRAAQNPESPLGKMLRIDVDRGSTERPLSAAQVTSAICMKGLRNPWRFSFDRQTGDLLIGDVGQDMLEEIDWVRAGKVCGQDFGWPAFEGSRCPNPSCSEHRDCPSGSLPPLLEYGRGDGCTVIGGYVYRGSCLGSFAGTYFYSDWCSGWVRSFRIAEGRAVEQRSWPRLGVTRPSSFGEDANGELYILSHQQGTVYRIVPAENGR